MLRKLPLLTALPLLVGAGVAEGLWTNRWTSAAALQTAAGRLADVPPSAGAWEGETLPLEKRQADLAGLRGYLYRRYAHATTGDTLSVLVVCGRPGPVAVHTPDVCYGGAGFEKAGRPERWNAGHLDAGAQFWSARFKKPGVTGEQLRIRWAWATAGPWQAADNPRLAFAGSASLYKIYLIQQVTGTEDSAAEDFLRRFLPQLRQALFP